MSTFNGIPISEHRLLVHSIIFSILFFGLMTAFGFWLYTSLTSKNPKERKRLRKLKGKAKNDENVKNQLDKIKRKNKRKNKRKRQRNKDNIIINVVIWSLTACLAVAILACGVIPGLTDYIKKTTLFTPERSRFTTK